MQTLVMPVHAQLIFTNDVFDNEAETFRIGEGTDASATPLTLEFGSTNSETLSWNFTNSQFEISDDVSLSNNEIKDVVIDNQSFAPVTPNPGQIYYDTSNNNTYIYNGTAWEDINNDEVDLDDAYDNDADKQIDVDNASGLTFDLTTTGDFVIEDNGTPYATFTDTGEFQVDNLQMDANTLSSTNVNGNVTIDPNGNGFVNLGANVNVDGETVVLDYDNTTGDITLQFGQALAETFIWDSANTRFTLSDDARIEGNAAIIGQTYIAGDHTATDSDGTINLGLNGSDWETWSFDSTADQFELSDDLNVSGNLGLGTTSPNFNLHLYDTTSTTAYEWQVFDNGTDQASILTGTQNPMEVATDADAGSIFLNTDTGRVYTKSDDGSTTNWLPSGLDANIYAALVGTFGTPGLTNKFVTNNDPRLSAAGGSFGETSLGTRLDYDDVFAVDTGQIFYSRIFLPADTTITSIGIFTTSARTGNINLAIYSDDGSGHSPVTKLRETGTQNGTSPVDDFWSYSLSTPFTIPTATFYWLAMASDSNPGAKAYKLATDTFIPFRVESKVGSSTTLPATATPTSLPNTKNLPFVAGFE